MNDVSRRQGRGGVGVEFIWGAIPIAFCCRPAGRVGVGFGHCVFGAIQDIMCKEVMRFCTGPTQSGSLFLIQCQNLAP